VVVSTIVITMAPIVDSGLDAGALWSRVGHDCGLVQQWQPPKVVN
jgi:hypothetical protein